MSHTLGILDWGIGGLGLLNMLGRVEAIYLSDAGFAPYGKVGSKELRPRVELAIEHLRGCGATRIAVACNAASSVTPVQDDVINVVDHGVRMVAELSINEVAVIGGERTVEGGSYRIPLEALGIKVHQRVAQPLSAHIEAGRTGQSLNDDLELILTPLLGIKHMVLGCTHYPAISDRIQEFVPDSRLLDPSEHMRDWIRENWKLKQGQVAIRTTGDAENMKHAAAKAFGNRIEHIEKIEL